MKTHPLEEAGCPARAIPAEDAEKLLRAVAHKEKSEDQTQDKKGKIHPFNNSRPRRAEALLVETFREDGRKRRSLVGADACRE